MATARVASIPGYDFETVRFLQDRCQSALIQKVEDSNDPKFIRIKRLIKDAEYESALQLLNAMITHCEDNSSGPALDEVSMGESESPCTLQLRKQRQRCTIEQLLLTRAEVLLKKKRRVKARNDAQLCILKKPNFMPAYGLLSTIEYKRREYGQAEQALKLGFFMDSGNKVLIQKRNSLLSTFYPESAYVGPSAVNTQGCNLWQLYAKKNLQLLSMQQKNALIG